MTAPVDSLGELLRGPGVPLALAPMQDITDLPFWRVLMRYGGADLYFTEYFRVYAGSHLNRSVLRSVTENPSGRPVIAQMIGNDVAELVRTARELQEYPVAGIDLNLGCPAPVVYRKCAGGGLLREPERVSRILGALREAVRGRLTVKTRLGFADAAGFEALLTVLGAHGLDLVTVHGRTVADGYRTSVRYDLIAQAVRTLSCPVLANGNLHSAAQAVGILGRTGARGLMIGRGAIRNPWLFAQIRQHLAGKDVTVPVGREVLGYVRELYDVLDWPGARESSRVARIKKHLNFLGVGVDAAGQFLHRIRRVTSEPELFGICEHFLDHDELMPLAPYELGLKPTDVMAGEQG